jgi:hypothetical protein
LSGSGSPPQRLTLFQTFSSWDFVFLALPTNETSKSAILWIFACGQIELENLWIDILKTNKIFGLEIFELK